MQYEKFKYTKREIGDEQKIQYSKKMVKRANNDLQSTTQKTKDWPP